jgi:hypothetical protein
VIRAKPRWVWPLLYERSYGPEVYPSKYYLYYLEEKLERLY